MAIVDAVVFPGKGDLKLKRLFFSGTGIVSSSVFAPELAEEKQRKHTEKELRRVCSVFFQELCNQQEGL